MYSLLIKQALVVDGTDTQPYIADVAVEGDKIVNIAEKINTSALDVVQANGLVLSPGFIDLQNHSDIHWRLFDGPGLESMLTQGYTTIMTGNSGASLAPLITEEALLPLRKWHSLEGLNTNWRSFAEYSQYMQQRSFGTNVGSLVGYSTLRRGLIGDRQTALTESELATLEKLMGDAMSEGAFGVSTGFAYAHESNITELELHNIARIVAKNNAYLAFHLRNESDNVVDSVREALSAVEQTGVNLKISHIKIRYPKNQHLLKEVLSEIESGWHKGQNIHFDVYPYTSTWQALYTYLPKWATIGGRKQILQNLKNQDTRRKILDHLINSDSNIPDLTIASTSSKLLVTGKKISEIAQGFGITSEETLLHLVEHGGSEVLVFETSLDDNSVNIFCNHPLSFIASNGSGYSIDETNKLVHPRCFGTAPKFLHNAITNHNLPLAEAIRKLTSGPAKKIGLQNRGTIKVDTQADLVLFDPHSIDSKASLTNPSQYALGISRVWVNGQLAVLNGKPTGKIAGKFLNRK